jgi:hypothetical protein
VVSLQQKQALKGIAAQLARHVPCGLKDPRLLLLLDTWIEIVDSYALVGTFRHPVAVARSLARRNGMPEKEAYNLWVRYNAKLVQWHRAYRFPIIRFDLSDLETYCRTVAALAITLGLNPDMTRLREFVDSEQEHYSSIEEPVPAMCQKSTCRWLSDTMTGGNGLQISLDELCIPSFTSFRVPLFDSVGNGSAIWTDIDRNGQFQTTG